MGAMKRLASLCGVLLVAGAAVACGGAQGATDPAVAGAGSDGDGEPGAAAGEGERARGDVAVAGAPAPEVNTLRLENREIAMDFDLTLSKGGAAGGIQSGNWSVYEERSQKILAIEDGVIAKLQVAYGRREAKPLLGVEKPSFTSGKTYFVVPGAVTLAGEKPAPDKEAKAVLAEYAWVGGPSPLARALAGKTAGSELDLDVAARRMLVGELPGIDHEKTEITAKLVAVEAAKRPRASLEVSLKSELDAGDVQFRFELTGPAHVDVITGWVTSMKLAGKVKAEGTVKHKKGSMDATGSGKANITRQAEIR
jgi:hypothetical protein